MIGQFVNPVEGERILSIVILASMEYHFIRVHENLMQHPSNNISIVISDATSHIQTHMSYIQKRFGFLNLI